MIAGMAATAAAQDKPQPEIKPRIRTITAFLGLDGYTIQGRLRDVSARLQDAKKLFEKAGYEVQTLRVATPPFPDSLANQLGAINQWGNAEKLMVSVGPAVTTDGNGRREIDRSVDQLKATNLKFSLIVADRQGVHWPNVKLAARIMARLRDETPGSQGNFNFAAIAMVPPGCPFFPAAYHDGAGPKLAIGWEAANLIEAALKKPNRDAIQAEAELDALLRPHAVEVDRLGRAAATLTRLQYAGVDLSPAPMKDVSIGRAIEIFTGAPVGSSGTMTIAATITRVLQSMPVQRAGYCGLMMPVLEDSVLAQRWSERRLSIDSLLAYSAVCGTGLDTVPLPGDITEDQMARIIGDVASLAFRWNKPLSVRLMPVKGLKAGDTTKFDDPYLVNSRLQPL
jgi:uncharacterized protein (UPF0210 family)